MQLIDSHCHLNFEGLAERLPEVLENMAAQDVKQALAISVSRQSFDEVSAIAEQYPHIYCTVGIHPDREDAEEFTVAELVERAKHPKVVGIGETGLDYYWCKGDLAWQHQRFADHIEAANESGLPVIVHTRDAAADTLKMLKECNTHAGVIHCFSEDIPFAKAALDLGLYISFSGLVTFKNAPLIQETAKYVPSDRILVETDAPFLAPVPKRGKQNEPSYVRHTAEFVAKLRGETLEEVAAYTTENFYRLFTKVPRWEAA
ncbi:TatD family hydrolase [Neisseria animalis]|uniref:TatD family deoxyribonuclease n=1 Tax=Neisseria animalis TaxID=492 RepID=A0A5P3MPN3_NEIAN|nr:TatD family hydrolase [Neisseria animalis]QEY23448.1 TatD family deoxyribonuclease [Neisseria animalis]ROW33293.1 TatD family deoxyribonuclease [Neisseria animalis]VEE08961.1 Mg-dependent DNase [Neisseria animalis]